MKKIPPLPKHVLCALHYVAHDLPAHVNGHGSQSLVDRLLARHGKSPLAGRIVYPVNQSLLEPDIALLEFDCNKLAAEQRGHLKKFEDQYLKAFKKGEVDFQESYYKYHLQVDKFSPHIGEILSSHATYWLSENDFVDWDMREEGGNNLYGYHFCETLLCLENDKEIRIHDCRLEKNGAIQFEVSSPVRTVIVNGIEINFESQSVSFQGHSNHYQASALPWNVIRMCAEEAPDSLGFVSVDFFSGKTKSELNNTFSRINSFWKEKTGYRIISVKDDMICLKPIECTE